MFTENKRDGYLNTRGEIAIAAIFESADRFSEGLAAVQIDRKYGYINVKGKSAVKPSFALAFPFRSGFARVIKQSGCLYIGYGPCDFFNPVILPFTFSAYRQPMTDQPPCMYSFIDRTGRVLSPTTYRDAKDFSEHLAAVGNGRLWGFLDANGTTAIPLQYENAEPFSEGLAAVEIDGKWGYVNHAGELVIASTFLTAFPFSEGVAVTKTAVLQYHFIDKTGKPAIRESFSGASSFVLGRAHVQYGVDHDSATWAYIDHRGRQLFRYSKNGKLTP